MADGPKPRKGIKMTLDNLFGIMWSTQQIIIYIDGVFKYRGMMKDCKHTEYNERRVVCIRSSDRLNGVVEIVVK